MRMIWCLQLIENNTLLFLLLSVCSVNAQYAKLVAGRPACFAEWTMFSGEPLVVSYENLALGESSSWWMAGTSTISITVDEMVSAIRIHDEVAHGLNHTTLLDAPIAGLYKICLTLEHFGGGSDSTLSLEVDILRGFDPSRGGKKESMLKVVESTAALEAYIDHLDAIHESVALVQSNVASLVSWHEGQLDSTAKSAFLRVVAFTLINCILVFVVGAWQILHLKRYFREKKLV